VCDASTAYFTYRCSLIEETMHMPPDIRVLRNVRSIEKFIAGFERFYLVDAKRHERFNPLSNRQFEVLIWYPADPVKGMQPKRYLSNHNPKKLLLLNWRFGKNAVNKIVAERKTHSYEGVPVSGMKSTYPVLLFSHDMASLPEYYTLLMESLALDGYFIFSINHSYLSEESTLHNEKGIQSIPFEKRFLAFNWFVDREIQSIVDSPGYGAKWEISRKSSFMKELLREPILEWRHDKKFLLDYLQEINNSDGPWEMPHNFFRGRLDLTQVATIGHGWGGASGVHSLLADSRVKAAVNLNGFQFSEGIENTLTKPLLMIYSEDRSGMNDGIYFSDSQLRKEVLPQSTDDQFTDRPFYFSSGENENELLCARLFNKQLDLIHSFLKEHLNTPHLVHLKTRYGN
jgi:hypothetical protein